MNTPRNLSLLAAWLALAAAGCSGQVSAQATKGAGPPPPSKVLVTSARQELVRDARSFVGTVRPIRRKPARS